MRVIYDSASVLALLLLIVVRESPLSWLLFPASDHAAPDHNTFYTPPANLSAYAVGEPIWSQRSSYGVLVRNVGSVHQVLYRTNTTEHEPSATVVTVFTPKHIDRSRVQRVVSVQLWEDAASLNCAPSYTLTRGFRAPNVFTGLLDAPVLISMALARGWHVIVPDHQGPRSAFMSGFEEGQATLDGVRAGLAFLDLPADAPVGLIGYSGGAHATAWAAHLHEQYAPDLRVVSAAYGGTPIDLNMMIAHLNGQPFSGMLVAGLSGVLAGHRGQEAELRSHLGPELNKAIDLMRSRDFCVLNVVSQSFGLDWMSRIPLENGATVFDFEPFQQLVRQETLLANNSLGLAVPKFPRYLWHAESDEMVTHEPALQYVQEQCDAGADIVEFVLYPGMEHLMAMLLGAPRAVRFTEQVFDDSLPAPRTERPCGPITRYWEPPRFLSSLSIARLTSAFAGSSAGKVSPVSSPAEDL